MEKCEEKKTNYKLAFYRLGNTEREASKINVVQANILRKNYGTCDGSNMKIMKLRN
jgi:hypothetical protein